MMTLRTTTALQRVDMLLVQAERFAELKVLGEAAARAKQVIAHAERERKADPACADAFEMRAMLAESLLRRLGRRVRDRRGDARD